jgi:hypothetical protein
MGLRAVLILTLLAVACGTTTSAPAAPDLADLVPVVAAMPAWADDPVVAADGQPAVCARLDRLAVETPRPPAAARPPGLSAALARFVATCRAYDQALAAYPVDRVRWERYWHESLKEGVMVASDYWRDEMVASQARLDHFQARWRAATRAAERERALGCAALAELAPPPGQLVAACPPTTSAGSVRLPF